MTQMTTKRSPNFNKEGYEVRMTGYVTQLIWLINKSSQELERSLGYSSGSLSQGWALYVLTEGVGPRDFIYQGRSRYSGGMAYDRDATQQLRDVGMINGNETMRVRRVDQLRYQMFVNTKDEMAFDCFLTNENVKLNQRKGSHRIAKLVPLSRVNDYPDSPGNGVPQWEIVVPKTFFCIAVVGPDRKYMAGGYPVMEGA
jgi:hypothetical protein